MSHKYIICKIFAFILIFSGYLYSAVDSKLLYEQGIEALNSGNYGSADLIFRKIIDSSNDDEYKDEAYFYRALTIFYQKKYKSAIFEFNSYLNKCRTTGLCIESRYWIGESYYFLKKYNEAIEEYKRFILNSKDEKLIALANDRIGIIYYSQARYDEAVIEWEKAIRSSKSDKLKTALVIKIGEALFRSGKYNESMRRLRPVLKGRADLKTGAKVRLIIGRIYQNLNRHKKAINIFNEIPDSLLKEYPFSEVQYFKAVSYMERGNYNRAVSLLELFILIGKESDLYYDARFALGKIFIKTGKEEKGIKLLEDVRNKSSGNKLKMKASIILSNFFIKKNPGKAVSFLEEYIKNNTIDENREILLLTGKAYIEAGQFDSAELLFDRYIKKYPYEKNSEEIEFLRGRIFLGKGNIDKAIELFENLRKENPFSKYINESNYYLALVSFKKNNYKKAVRILNKYLRQRAIENRYNAVALLARCYIFLKDLRRAGRTVDYIIKKYIKNAGVENIIYKYFIAAHGNKKKARKYFNILTEHFPQSDAVMKLYLLLAGEHFLNKEYDIAEEYYKKYLSGKHKFKRGNAFYNRLLSLYNLKKYKDILNILHNEKIPPLDENQWSEIPLLINRCYFYLKDYNVVYNRMYSEPLEKFSRKDLLLFVKSAIKVGDLSAAKTAGQMLSGNKDLYAESLYSIGEYYYKNVQIDEAIGLYSRIIIEAPDSKFVDPAKLKLAEIYISNNRYKDAIAKLKEIKSKDYRNKKNSMLITAYFKDNRQKEGIKLTRRELYRLLRSEEGEIVMKTNLFYYYEKGDIKNFKRFGRFLNRYKGNKYLINYLSGKLYYRKKDYKKAYFYYYRLSLGDNKYLDEALFYLGKISLYVYRNKKNAVKYFKKIADKKSLKNRYQIKAKLNLAIILNEKKIYNDSKKYLTEIINEKKRGIPVIQAKNLIEIYNLK